MMNGASTSESSLLRDGIAQPNGNNSHNRCSNCSKFGHMARNCKSEREDESDHKGEKILIPTVSKNYCTSGVNIDADGLQNITTGFAHFP